jgi:hypothetical protein
LANYPSSFVSTQKISDDMGDILPIPTSKCQNKNEKENLGCWCEPLLTNWQHTSA